MHSKQSNLWLLAAIAAPAAHFSGSGWLTALITAAVILPLSLLKRDWTFPKPIALLQILWLGIVAGALLPAGAACWPSDNALAVPLTLLTLAALTPAAHAPRIGAVLAFAMGLLALPIAISGAANLKLRWLMPTALTFNPMLALVLLLPALPTGETGKGRGIVGIGILSITVSALIQGVLSYDIAVSLPDPEYQTARTLGYLEPVAAAALTLGWYAVTTLLFSAAAEIAQKSQMGERLSYVLLWGTAATAIAFGWQPSATILMGLSAFLWCFTPFFQKMKKVKNSA